MTENRYTMSEPTSYLRFVERDGRRILQQRWAVTSYLGTTHSPIGKHGEWRDVPVEDETN